MRFRAEQRLHRQLDIRVTRERGRRIDCGGFTLWCYRRPVDVQPVGSEKLVLPPSAKAPSIARVCVVASTAAVGGAIFRNRAKRRMREVFRRNQTLVPRDYDLLMVARTALTRLPFSEIERKFVEGCLRLSVAKP